MTHKLFCSKNHGRGCKWIPDRIQPGYQSCSNQSGLCKNQCDVASAAKDATFHGKHATEKEPQQAYAQGSHCRSSQNLESHQPSGLSWFEFAKSAFNPFGKGLPLPLPSSQASKR